MSVGLVSGTSVSHSERFRSWEAFSRTNAYGEVHGKRCGGLIALNRHGPEGRTAPHAIDHRANIRFFADLGVTELVALSSVGSLREDLAPGTLVSCGDYVSFHPVTFQEREARPVTPGLDNTRVPDIARASGYTVVTDRVYVQTPGPRFETRAEIRILRQWGDVVGMTLAGEADLCAELGIRLHSLAIVDNYANGVGDRPLTPEAFERQVAAHREKADRLLKAIQDLYA